MPLKKAEMENSFFKFNQLRKEDHRYASFDYCYNYFQQFRDKKEIGSKDNLEKSCLQLGFFVSSWGMIRPRSFLLQKSLKFYVPIINWLAYECPKEVWKIDVNNYNERNLTILIKAYNEIANFIPEGKRQLVLVTKIMLGIFGNTPAFDNNFTKTFKAYYGSKTRYGKFDAAALQSIKDFYNTNNELIEKLRKKSRTFNFSRGRMTNRLYTRAKIIDMIGFGYQI